MVVKSAQIIRALTTNIVMAAQDEKQQHAVLPKQSLPRAPSSGNDPGTGSVTPVPPAAAEPAKTIGSSPPVTVAAKTGQGARGGAGDGGVEEYKQSGVPRGASEKDAGGVKVEGNNSSSNSNSSNNKNSASSNKSSSKKKNRR